VQQRYLVYLHSTFSKCLPEAAAVEYKWMTDPLHADSPQNYDFSLAREEEVCSDIICDSSLKAPFPEKSHIQFWLFSRLVRNASNIFHTFATSKTYTNK
jgi:hypothetical protein